MCQNLYATKLIKLELKNIFRKAVIIYELIVVSTLIITIFGKLHYFLFMKYFCRVIFLINIE